MLINQSHHGNEALKLRYPQVYGLRMFNLVLYLFVKGFLRMVLIFTAR